MLCRQIHCSSNGCTCWNEFHCLFLMPIPPVIDLSDEECPSEGLDAQLLPSLWRKKRKRQTDGPPPRETMESQLKVLLGKRCVSCRHNCMQKFSEPAKFETLVEFKRDWLALHKLDQDQAVPWVRQLQDFVGRSTFWGKPSPNLESICFRAPSEIPR